MKREESKEQKIWSAVSIALLCGFISLSSYIFLTLKLNFNIFVFLIIMNSVIFPTVLLFLDRSGYGEKLWEFWKNLPLFLHKTVCFLCLFWIGYVSWKWLIPAVKKDYEGNQ